MLDQTGADAYMMFKETRHILIVFLTEQRIMIDIHFYHDLQKAPT